MTLPIQETPLAIGRLQRRATPRAFLAVSRSRPAARVFATLQ